jgi:hypothetical protein
VTFLSAFLAGYMPSTLVQIALSIFGMVGGPILAVFSVGILCPHVNSWVSAEKYCGNFAFFSISPNDKNGVLFGIYTL